MGQDLNFPLRLPDVLRSRLAAPFGPVLQSADLPAALVGSPVAAVGDIVSLTLKEAGIRPRLIAVDYRTQRGEDPALRAALGTWGDRVVEVVNPPATITKDAWQAVADAFRHGGTTRIEVTGEEDLLGLPVILEAPLGTKFVYGMPGQGAVVADVTDALKEQARDLVTAMGQP